MGMWAISIKGVGAHHNPVNPGDADKLLRDFVRKLEDSGQTVEHASITFGGRETIRENSVYTKRDQ